jgi:putative transposase
MRLVNFGPGAAVTVDGRRFRLINKDIAGNWQVVDCETQCISQWTAHQLYSDYCSGRLEISLDQVGRGKVRAEVKPLSIADLPSAKQELVKFKFHFLQSVDRRTVAGMRHVRLSGKSGATLIERVLGEVSAELGRSRPVSLATYYRWKAQLERGPITDLAGRHGAPKGRRCSGAPIANQVMATAILEAKESKAAGSVGTITMARIAAEVRRRIVEENVRRSALGGVQPPLDVPSKATLHRIWHEFPADERAAAEHGKVKARAMFRGLAVKSRPDACLDLVEYDETRLPFFFFDEQSGVPLGRGWLNWYLDVRSAVPIGFYVGFEPPSDLTIASALKHACLPKSYVAEAYPKIENDYVGGGVPRTVTFDNGLAQWGKTIETIALDLNMTIQFATVRTPWFKPIVEGMFKLLNTKLLQELPGFVIGKRVDAKDYDPTVQGCIGLRHFLYILHVWLVDVYLQTPQGPFKRTPAERWAEGTAAAPPDFLPRAADLDILFGVVRSGRLDHRGVVFEHLRYYSAELHLLRRQFGDRLRVEVKINPSDLGVVHVRLEGTTGWVRADAMERSYASGLSLHRHKLNLRHANEKYKDLSIESLHRAEAFLQELIAEALPMALSIRTNSLIARALGIGTQHIFDQLSPEGALGPLTGPFAGQPLNPFPAPIQPSPLATEPDASPIAPLKSARRPIPDFDADFSLRGGA